MINLDVHTIYSPRKSIVKIDELLNKAKELNQKAIAITDDNGLYGIVEFFDKAEKRGIKPIIGCELQFCEDISIKDKTTYSLTILCKNLVGYKNICKIITKSYLEGFYYKARCDFSILKEFNEGLVCILSSDKNIVCKSFLENKKDYAEYNIKLFNDIFHEDFYIAINPYTSKEYKNYINWIIKTYSDICIVTNHIRFLEPSRYQDYDMIYVMNNGLNFNDKTRTHANENDYFRTEEEIIELLGQKYKKFLDRTDEIAEKCNFKFEKKLWFPKPDTGDLSSEEYLKKLITDNFGNKRLDTSHNISEYKDRLRYETEAICRLGYADYFIVVADIVNWARSNDIEVGDGRGSAAGCLVSYVLGITNVDPIKYGLIFERFLDPTGQRISPPDIDIDFQDSERDRVVKYAETKYGSNKVACVGNLSTLAFKSSIKDVARAFGVNFNKINTFTKEIPWMCNTTEELLQSFKIKRTVDSEPEFAEVLKYVDGVKGSMKNLGTHAAGIVIAPTDITDFTPLQIIETPSSTRITTQFDKDAIEKIGLFKIDILGLTALTTIKNCLKLVKKNKNIDIDLDSIDLNNRAIYKNIAKNRTLGIFQLEGKGMTELGKAMGVNNLNDICDLIALYRPAVLESGLQDVYVDNKVKIGKKTVIHPKLDKIVKDTYGVLIYQEQIMQAAVQMAGFSVPESDMLRKAIGKKSTKDIPILKEKFIKGCIANKISEDDAIKVFSIFEDAGYAFNKSHSLSYAIIAAKTAYLKHYYPYEYICACMISEKYDQNILKKYFNECRNYSIEILPPDINSSEFDFNLENKGIRYGLSSIKEIGESFANEIPMLRHRYGKFSSLNQFLSILASNSMLDANKSKVIILIKAGVFDSLEINRKKLINELETFGKINKTLIKQKNKNPLFNIFDTVDSAKNCADFPVQVKQLDEQEYLGVSFT